MLAAVAAGRAAGGRPAGAAAAPGWRWASCTTWRSGCTRTAPTPGALQGRLRPRASRSARRRTRTTRTARTGASRRGGRTGWPRPAYAPFREMVSHDPAPRRRHPGRPRDRAVPAVVDPGRAPDPSEGTYVRYDHEAMIGILALEAHRAGALVVGEDLGTVEPWVRDYLRERGILGTSILWFEFDCDGDGAPLKPELWREYCLASVTTHDLPPTAGYLAGDHVRLRDRLGILTRTLEEELAVDQAERQAWLDNLRAAGCRCRTAPRSRTTPGPAPLPDLDAVPAAVPRADRRGRGPAGPEPAGHHRRVPELARAADAGRTVSPVMLEDVLSPSGGAPRRWRRSSSGPLITPFRRPSATASASAWVRVPALTAASSLSSARRRARPGARRGSRPVRS